MLTFSSSPFSLSPRCTLPNYHLSSFTSAATVFGRPPHPITDFTATLLHLSPSHDHRIHSCRSPRLDSSGHRCFATDWASSLPTNPRPPSLIVVDIVWPDFLHVEDHRHHLFPCLTRSITLFWAQPPRQSVVVVGQSSPCQDPLVSISFYPGLNLAAPSQSLPHRCKFDTTTVGCVFSATRRNSCLWPLLGPPWTHTMLLPLVVIVGTTLPCFHVRSAADRVSLLNGSCHHWPVSVHNCETSLYSHCLAELSPTCQSLGCHRWRPLVYRFWLNCFMCY